MTCKYNDSMSSFYLFSLHFIELTSMSYASVGKLLDNTFWCYDKAMIPALSNRTFSSGEHGMRAIVWILMINLAKVSRWVAQASQTFQPNKSQTESYLFIEIVLIWSFGSFQTWFSLLELGSPFTRSFLPVWTSHLVQTKLAKYSP